jgi:hypothetical protein
MQTFILLGAGTHVEWYLIPLAAAVSIVYSATRYEYAPRILRRALQLFLTILISMAAIFAVLYLLSMHL